MQLSIELAYKYSLSYFDFKYLYMYIILIRINEVIRPVKRVTSNIIPKY